MLPEDGQNQEQAVIALLQRTERLLQSLGIEPTQLRPLGIEELASEVAALEASLRHPKEPRELEDSE